MTGRKAVTIVLVLGAVASLIQAIGALLPMHKLGVSVGGGVLVMMMNMHLTSVYIMDVNSKALSIIDPQNLFKLSKEWWAPGTMQGWHNLEDMKMEMCTDFVRVIWPGMCDGLEAAHGTGIALIIILVSNMICQAVGCYMLFDYATRKQNPKYREIAAIMISGGCFAMIVVIIIYGMAVCSNLSSMGGTLLQASRSSGASNGFITIIIGLIVQAVQCVLLITMTQNEWGEDDYYDNKEAREAQLEMSRMGGGGAMGHPPGQSTWPPQPMAQPGIMVQPQMMIIQPMASPMMTTGGAW